VKRSALIRFVAFLGVLAVLVGYVAYHKPAGPTASTPPTGTTAPSQATANYIANLKQQRDQLMSKEMATLRGLVNSSQVSAAARNQAEATLVQDTQELKQEMQIEGLLGAHGFPLTVAMVNPNQVEVVVGQAALTEAQVAQIADTVTQVTGLPPQDIVVVPKTGSD
jgi:hypothetical protein